MHMEYDQHRPVCPLCNHSTMHKGIRDGRQRYMCVGCHVMGYAETFVLNAVTQEARKKRVPVSRPARARAQRLSAEERQAKLDAQAMKRAICIVDTAQSLPLPMHLEPALVHTQECSRCCHIEICRMRDRNGLHVICEEIGRIFVGKTKVLVEV